MEQRLLVPLDGSAAAEQILPQVGRLLRREDAEVLLLRVEEAPDAAATAYVDALAATLGGKGIRARGVVRRGLPARGIVEAAVEEKATLIALGTHGRSGPARWLLGSVAEQVLRAAPVPVLLARRIPSVPTSVAAAQPFRRILAPFDGSEASLNAVEPVAAFAALFGAEVDVLSVEVPVALPVAGGGFIPPMAGPGAAALAAQGAERYRARGVAVRERTAAGDPAVRILEAAGQSGADLIAMATHGRSGLERCLLGSTAERVLRRATVPLLIVRNPGA